MPALQFAARGVCRRPAASLLAMGTMAVGVGLVTALLAVLDGTLWHPLPYPSADRLVALAGVTTRDTVERWTAAGRSFQALSGYRSKRYTLTGAGDAQALRATVATAGLFDVLETRPALGRAWRRAEAVAGTPVAVLSDECWRATFQADPSVVGRPVLLNGTEFTVIGVMPPGIRFPVDAERVDLYTTVTADLQTDRSPSAAQHPRDLRVIGRLASGATLDGARAEVETFRAADDPSTARRPEPRARLVVPLAVDVAGPVLAPLRALTWAVIGVGVVACLTATILSLIRVVSRRAEWATRLALGATPGDLMAHVLAESVLIAAGGAAVGSFAAYVGVGPLLRLAGPAVAAAARARFDADVWAWTALVTVGVALSFGIVPAIQVAAMRWVQARADAAGPGRAGSAARDALVGLQVALAVVLLAGCTAVVRAYSTLAAAPTGFDASRVTVFRIDLSDATYARRQQAEFFERLRVEARTVAGVSAAGFTALPPFGDLRFTIRLPPPDATPGSDRAGAEVNLVSPGYFAAMGIPVLAGREFDGSDASDREPVVIVSRTIAARHFPGSDPIGRVIDVRVGPNAKGPMPRVVGVVGDVLSGSLTAPGEPQVYLPFAQAPMIASATFTLRTGELPPATLLREVRRVVGRLDASVPVVSARPMADLVRNAAALPRFATVVSAIFAGAALFLSMAGLYAVVTYAALCRRREFSIRRALGATESRIAREVIGHGAKVVLPGMGVGLLAAVLTGRALEGVLFGVKPAPPLTLGVALAAAALTAVAASWAPARAAGRDDLRARLRPGD